MSYWGYVQSMHSVQYDICLSDPFESDRLAREMTTEHEKENKSGSSSVVFRRVRDIHVCPIC